MIYVRGDAFAGSTLVVTVGGVFGPSLWQRRIFTSRYVSRRRSGQRALLVTVPKVRGGNSPPLSSIYKLRDKLRFLKLLTHEIRLLASFALASPGNNIPARIAIMAMTTSSSIKVKAWRDAWFFFERATGMILVFFMNCLSGLKPPSPGNPSQTK